MDKVRRYELGDERGKDVGEEDDGFGDAGTDEVECCGEDYYVEDVVY